MRPIARWHGGKWRIANWIISHIPPHRFYVEPFCGAASVLLQKPRSKVEVLNDAYNRIINAFRVIRDHPEDLARALRFSPYAEEEYRRCREESDDPIEDARRMIVLGHQSHGSTGACTGGKRSGWRRGVRQRTSSADEWADVWKQIEDWAERLRGCYIEHGDAFGIIARWESEETVIYADPPYLPEVRSRSSGKGAYGPYEMSQERHVELSEVLRSFSGAVLISGYSCTLYDELYQGWTRVDHQAFADRGSPRTECLWLNPKAANSVIPLVSNFEEARL